MVTTCTRPLKGELQACNCIVLAVEGIPCPDITTGQSQNSDTLLGKLQPHSTNEPTTTVQPTNEPTGTAQPTNVTNNYSTTNQ